MNCIFGKIYFRKRNLKGNDKLFWLYCLNKFCTIKSNVLLNTYKDLYNLDWWFLSTHLLLYLLCSTQAGLLGHTMPNPSSRILHLVFSCAWNALCPCSNVPYSISNSNTFTQHSLSSLLTIIFLELQHLSSSNLP